MNKSIYKHLGTYKGIFPEVRVTVHNKNAGPTCCSLGHLEACNLGGLGQDTPCCAHWWEQPLALLQTVFEVLQRLEVLTVQGKDVS